MAIKNLTLSEFNDAVSVKDKLIVIDFWASWCYPCTRLSPIIDELSEEMSDVVFYKVNVDEENALAAHFSVSSIPTVLMIKDLKIVNQFVGYLEKPAVKAQIEASK